MRPPLVRKLHNPHDISALPLVTKPGHPAELHVNGLQVGVGVAHEGLAQIVDTVPHVAGRRVAAVLRLDPVPGGIVTPADGVEAVQLVVHSQAVRLGGYGRVLDEAAPTLR